MGLFKRNKIPNQEVQHDNRVEVVVHKEATKKVVNQAKAANKQLNLLLQQNGFTIKIFLAAGGKTKKVVIPNGH
jgi:hypothetical protein